MTVLDLKDAEVQLIKLLREIRYGEVTIKLRDGIPYIVSEWRKDVKLVD